MVVDKPIFELKNIMNVGGKLVNTLGYYVVAGPVAGVGGEEAANQITEINYTGKPGTASGIYYSLFFQLPKWDWHLEKVDEWIEVTPTHKEYYDRTMATKQVLENTIKSGLASAAQAVADFELLSHDLRRYKEILGYFGKKDEQHSLKSMFIDQVDNNTGALSISEMTRNRWPTMTADFHRLEDGDMDVKKIMEKLGIAQAEAIILVTKNKLFIDWKKYFGKAVRDRYQRLRGLILSREKSIKEYKEWLKPYITRFKATRIGMADSERREFLTKTYLDVAGLSTFINKIRMYAWKPLITREVRRPSEEIKGQFKIHPYDSYVRDVLILGKSNSLSKIYEWLRNHRKYCDDCKQKGEKVFYFPGGVLACPECGSTALEDKTLADKIVEEQIIPNWGRWADSFELYYMFLDVDIDRLGIRLPSGELEDITFTNKMYVISQNILLVKILELICRDTELERYIEEMLGFRQMEKDIDEILIEEFPDHYKKEGEKEISDWKKFSKEIRDGIKGLGGGFRKIKAPQIKSLSFVKPGHYETNMSDRIKKHFLTVSGSNFVQISDLIKSKMGME